MKRAAAVLLLLTACSTTKAISRPTSKLPDGLTRCTAPAGEIDSGDASCAADDSVCLETEKIAAECKQTLASEATEHGYKGTVLFGLNSDDSGNVTGVCFYGGTLGEAPNTLSCLAEKAKAKRFNIAPDAQESKWAVRYSVE